MKIPRFINYNLLSHISNVRLLLPFLSLSEISECFTRYSRTGYQRAATARGLLVVIFDRITYLFIYLKRV